MTYPRGVDDVAEDDVNTALFSYRFLLPVLFGWIGHAAGFLALAALAPCRSRRSRGALRA
ncbi:MAG: hypothetical protein HC882_09295, partial [Acidobacteria bacterium]|nr:hypothetical protein [Acidobacteriota bacterium]